MNYKTHQNQHFSWFCAPLVFDYAQGVCVFSLIRWQWCAITETTWNQQTDSNWDGCFHY